MRIRSTPARQHRAAIAIAAPALRPDRPRKRRPRRPTRPTTRRPAATRSSSPRPSAPSRVQDVPFSINAQTEEDIQRANASTHRGHQPQRRRPGGPEPRAGAEPGRRSAACPPGRSSATSRASRNRSASTSTKASSRCRCSRPTSTCSTSTASKRCAGRRARCSDRAASAAPSATSPTSRELGRTEGSVEANINTVDEGDIGYHLKGAINVPLGATAALRAVGYGTHYAGFIDAVGPAGGKNVNDGSRVGGRVVAAVGADARHQHHAARRLPEDRGRRLQPPGDLQPVSTISSPTPARELRQARAISRCCARNSATRRCSPT